MTINEYQKLALRTESGWPEERSERVPMVNQFLMNCNSHRRLMQGLFGLNGESGEAIDLLKKHLFQGHELDEVHVAKELGDIAWYLALSADAIGYDLETIFQMNIDKLRERYPDGFSEAQSRDRKEGDI